MTKNLVTWMLYYTTLIFSGTRKVMENILTDYLAPDRENLKTTYMYFLLNFSHYQLPKSC